MHENIAYLNLFRGLGQNLMACCHLASKLACMAYEAYESNLHEYVPSLLAISSTITPAGRHRVTEFLANDLNDSFCVMSSLLPTFTYDKVADIKQVMLTYFYMSEVFLVINN